MSMTPLDRLLSLLFDQYKTEFRPRFVSRLYTRLGRWGLGSTDLKGLDEVMPELQGNYYNAIIDRRPPRDSEQLEQWDKGSRLVTPVRFVEERYAGKGMFVFTLAVCFALCVAAAGVAGFKDGVAWVKDKFQETTTSEYQSTATVPAAGGISAQPPSPSKAVIRPEDMTPASCAQLRHDLDPTVQKEFITTKGVWERSEFCKQKFGI